jgi:hypothetical protein
MLIAFAVRLSERFFDSPYWITDAVLVMAFLGTLLIWYVRARKHKVLLGLLTPLLDERCAEARITNPLVSRL